ncbi:hypothetical protein CMV_019920, partial [Castanea mollissima]
SIHKLNKKKRVVVIITASIISGLLTLGLLWRFTWKTTNRRRERKKEDVDVPLFNFTTVATATNKFSPANVIGAGGFGPVYKGRLCNGQDIAVKRLSKNSRQDFGLARTFVGDESEVKTDRVVGTYGYMSPEYAVDGRFSVKSDVFSMVSTPEADVTDRPEKRPKMISVPFTFSEADLEGTSQPHDDALVVMLENLVLYLIQNI